MIAKVLTEYRADAKPPATLSAAQLASIWALTFEGHRMGTPVGQYAKCGCVCCRIRFIMDGGTIDPDPAKDLVL